MSCNTSYTNDLRDRVISNVSISYGWTYGIGWASVGIALAGSIASTIGLFLSAGDAGNPTISFKK